MELKLLILLLVAAGVVNLFLAGCSAKFLSSRGAIAFMAMMLCNSFYSIGYGMEIASSNLSDMLFWSNVQYIGISFIPAFNIIMCLKYTGRMTRNYWIYMPLIFIIPLITLASHYTTQHHELYYRNISVAAGGPFPMLSFDRGPLYIVHSLYANFSFLTGMLIFIDFVRKSSSNYKKQGLLMLSGYIFPWAGYIIYLEDVLPWKIDPTPLTLTVSSIFWAIAIFRYQLFDLLPVARDFIFESMTNGIIIIDNMKRIADFNHAAAMILPELNKKMIGTDIADVLGKYDKLISLTESESGFCTEEETMMAGSPMPLYYRALITPLCNHRGKEEGSIITLTNVTSHVHMMKEMEKLASLDPLTCIYNRRKFIELAETELDKANRYGRPLTLIIIDIDHFKEVNDTYGHITGDRALKYVVDLLAGNIRSVDIFARFGGEEFALLLPETEPGTGYLLAQRLCQSLAGEKFNAGTEKISITASFGVSGKLPAEKKTLELLLKDADAVLYEAKNSGRKRVMIKF